MQFSDCSATVIRREEMHTSITSHPLFVLKYAQLMTEEYLNALSEFEENPKLTVDEVTRRYATNIKWDRELKNNLKRKKKTIFDEKLHPKSCASTICHYELLCRLHFAQMKYQMDRIFPYASSENRVICVSGIGSKRVFSAFMTDMMPDVQLIFNGQCFPRWRYHNLQTCQTRQANEFQGFDEAPERIDNISDTALRAFREHYSDDTITKDDIFDYVYGVSYTHRVTENSSPTIYPR